MPSGEKNEKLNPVCHGYARWHRVASEALAFGFSPDGLWRRYAKMTGKGFRHIRKMVNSLASGKGLCSPALDCSKVGWKYLNLFGPLRLKMLVRSDNMHTVAGHQDPVLAPFSENCLSRHGPKIPPKRSKKGYGHRDI